MRPIIFLFASVVLLACNVSAIGHHKLIRLILAKVGVEIVARFSGLWPLERRR